jgi:uncharacterized membrane protein
MRLALFWWVLIIASAAATVFGIVSASESVLRTAVTFWFLLVCPGMAYIRLLRLNKLSTELTLAVALSIAIDTVVSLAQVLADAWSVRVSVGIVIVISFFGVILQMIFLPRLPVPQPAAESEA